MAFQFPPSPPPSLWFSRVVQYKLEAGDRRRNVEEKGMIRVWSGGRGSERKKTAGRWKGWYIFAPNDGGTLYRQWRRARTIGFSLSKFTRAFIIRHAETIVQCPALKCVRGIILLQSTFINDHILYRSSRVEGGIYKIKISPWSM